jgi:hypothetical protein
MKKNIRKLIFTVIIVPLLSSFAVQAQDGEGMTRYTPDFRFRDGIYVNFDQVKLNSPIPKAKLLTSTDYNDKDFFRKLFESDKIYYYDGMGIRQEIAKSSIWGYARNGVLYVQIQNNFNRITFVGSISHFVADVTTIDNRYYSPYGGYYDPYYYSPYNYGYGGYYPYGSYYSPYSRGNMTRNEIKQYLLDFENGKVIEFNQKNTELLLMKDQELYEEYVRLSRKDRKNLMFVYIRKFNEKNPLYIPENTN